MVDVAPEIHRRMGHDVVFIEMADVGSGQASSAPPEASGRNSDEPDSGTPHKYALIVLGILLGVVCLVAIIIIVVVFYRRKTKRWVKAVVHCAPAVLHPAHLPKPLSFKPKSVILPCPFMTWHLNQKYLVSHLPYNHSTNTISYLRLKWLKGRRSIISHTQWGRTYLSSLYERVPLRGTVHYGRRKASQIKIRRRWHRNRMKYSKILRVRTYIFWSLAK